MAEYLLEGVARDEVVREVVGELRELVEDDGARIASNLAAGLEDLPDVALGPWRADDVPRVGDPPLEPAEPLGAHVLRQDGHAPAAEQARDRDSSARIVAGRRPYRAVLRRVEAACDEARHEARIGREHLVSRDEGEPVP